jgi:hypothetical protein
VEGGLCPLWKWPENNLKIIGKIFCYLEKVFYLYYVIKKIRYEVPLYDVE